MCIRDRNLTRLYLCFIKYLGFKKIKMTDNNFRDENNFEELDDVCDECKKEDESVSQNLILTGFKLCKSCRLSKTIFPV
mgnify:CR=1 FL=1